jgi:ECF sigma factor
MRSQPYSSGSFAPLGLHPFTSGRHLHKREIFINVRSGCKNFLEPGKKNGIERGRLWAWEGPGDISRLLERWSGGDRAAFQELIPVVYDELRRLANTISKANAAVTRCKAQL